MQSEILGIKVTFLVGATALFHRMFNLLYYMEHQGSFSYNETSTLDQDSVVGTNFTLLSETTKTKQNRTKTE